MILCVLLPARMIYELQHCPSICDDQDILTELSPINSVLLPISIKIQHHIYVALKDGEAKNIILV